MNLTNIKKLTFVIMISFLGLSIACASESAISVLKNSQEINIRQTGYELGRLWAKKDKGYIRQAKDYLMGNAYELEENVAELLIEDQKMMNLIVSDDLLFYRKTSDDPIVKELQLGFSDYLGERILNLVARNKRNQVRLEEHQVRLEELVKELKKNEHWKDFAETILFILKKMEDLSTCETTES